MSLNFGYYPHRETIRAGDITISPLADFDDSVRVVKESSQIDRRWIHAPPQGSRDFISNTVSTKSYSSRVFGLPMTHQVAHAASTDERRLRFLMHCFGFFVGMRMDDSGAGFLDAAPIETGVLCDFVFIERGLERALEHADVFWDRYASDSQMVMTVLGVFQSLSLAHAPHSLAFEEFLYAYTAIEGCYAIGRKLLQLGNEGGHAARTARLCDALRIPVPQWVRDLQVSAVGVRNDAIHEGLFLGQPFGYQSLHDIAVPEAEAGLTRGMPHAMRKFVCRALLALLGIRDEAYLQSTTYHTSRSGIRCNS
jgi:hypothetical protein